MGERFHQLDKGKRIWMNGQLIDWDNAKIHVLTHALHYGTAVFEGMRCYETDRGPAIFRLHDHVRRLINSAKIYLMDFRYSADEIAQAIRSVVKVNGFRECYIRPIAYCGFGEMGVNPLHNKVDMAIACWGWGAYLGEDALKNGVRCIVSSWRKINSQSLPVQAKSSANYANSALAKIEALKVGYDEAIMLNESGLVAEGTGENIFQVKGGALYTPPTSSGILGGITRDTVIQLAQDLGVNCREVAISREELYISDEVFLTGTAAELTPIREVDGRRVGDGNYPVTRKLQAAYQDAVKGRSKHAEWLDHVT
jgi:branched-chain amino acid aminotransferase